MQGNLVLVTSIASRLLEASASTEALASQQVSAQLAEHFDLH